jgi:hypothetical protein
MTRKEDAFQTRTRTALYHHGPKRVAQKADHNRIYIYIQITLKGIGKLLVQRRGCYGLLDVDRRSDISFCDRAEVSQISTLEVVQHMKIWWVISISEYPSFQHGDELYQIAYIKHRRFLAATHGNPAGL